jgi:hypothetical protein
VTDPDEHDVALADPDLLILLGGEHIRHGHVVTGLQPRHAAGTRHVQQHPAADDAVGGEAVACRLSVLGATARLAPGAVSVQKALIHAGCRRAGCTARCAGRIRSRICTALATTPSLNPGKGLDLALPVAGCGEPASGGPT